MLKRDLAFQFLIRQTISKRKKKLIGLMKDALGRQIMNESV